MCTQSPILSMFHADRVTPFVVCTPISLCHDTQSQDDFVYVCLICQATCPVLCVSRIGEVAGDKTSTPIFCRRVLGVSRNMPDVCACLGNVKLREMQLTHMFRACEFGECASHFWCSDFHVVVLN